MILLLGEPADPVLAAVHAELRRRRAETFSTSLLFGQPSRFRWTLGQERSTWELDLGDGRTIRERDLRGVLVRRAPLLDGARWDGAERAYAFSEAAAAALAWLWSLRCPAIGRLPAGLHYRPTHPLLDWAPALRASGLRPARARVTNDLRVARDFAGGAAAAHLMGLDASYRVTRPSEWDALGALCERVPALVTRLHGPVRLACIVADEVVWNGAPAPELEPALLKLARGSRLDFLEVAIAREPGSDEERVVAVEPVPRLDRFVGRSRRRVVGRLCDQLAPERSELEVAR